MSDPLSAIRQHLAAGAALLAEFDGAEPQGVQPPDGFPTVVRNPNLLSFPARAWACRSTPRAWPSSSSSRRAFD
ncbi:MAG TPA: hypothetical protein VJN18_14485 [Polyangiaceae bacterium]|nr:hypothetical protein [Polyangiaceae bacterium]